jgi:hypothetical protein
MLSTSMWSPACEGRLEGAPTDESPPTLATLTWEAPTTNADGSAPLTDLAGYTVYYGATSRTAAGFTAYDTALDVGNSPICALTGSGTLECVHVLSGFTAGTTVYFAVTAYDSGGNESGYSNEASKTFSGGD